MSCRHCIYQSAVYEGEGEVPAVAEDDDFEKSFPSRCGHGWGGSLRMMKVIKRLTSTITGIVPKVHCPVRRIYILFRVVASALGSQGPFKLCWTPSYLCFCKNS